jgi:hypothetical protein
LKSRLLASLKNFVTSSRASHRDLRGSFHGVTVDKFGSALCVAGGGEQGSGVTSQHLQPGWKLSNGGIWITSSAMLYAALQNFRI